MKISVNKKFQNSIYYWLLLLFVPIEAVGGVMANYGGGAVNAIGYIYRGTVILLFGKRILKKKNSRYLIASIILLLGILVNSVIRINSNLESDIMEFIRILYFESLVLGLVDLVRANKIPKAMLEMILKKSSILVMIIYAISLFFGKGLVTYTDAGTGYKAFFNSTNSLTIVLIILSSFHLMLFQRDGKKKDMIIYGIISVFLFLLGSKSGYFFWAMYLLYSYRPKSSIKYAKQIMLIAIVFPIGIYIFLNRFSTQINAIISRFIYFATSSSSNLEFLLSGRNNLLLSGWKGYLSNLNILDIVIGKGSYNMQIVIGQISNWGILKNVEMDFFDVFFCFGIVGLIVTYYLSIRTVLKGRKIRFDAEFVMFLMCIIFSVLGGHVFMDSFGSTIFALIIALNIQKKEMLYK